MRCVAAAVIAGALLFALGMAFRYALERPYPIDTYREDDDGIQPADPRTGVVLSHEDAETVRLHNALAQARTEDPA